MKIRKISFENHPVFSTLHFDFTDGNGKTINTIIIAGENGVGKSLLLNTIFEFSQINPSGESRNEKRTFEIELSNGEINILKTAEETKRQFSDTVEGNIFEVEVDYNIANNWNQVKIAFKKFDGQVQVLDNTTFAHTSIKILLRTIFSDVEINFTPQQINTVTSTNIDRENTASERSNSNLATEITQLLIDVQSLDALEFTEWARENIGTPVDNQKIDVRLKRFTNAFDFMFPSKKYKRIVNANNSKQIIFEENGREMAIDKLSSGEKQIVFRGGFLLKDKESSKGCFDFN